MDNPQGVEVMKYRARTYLQPPPDKKLREILQKADFTCRFCGHRGNKRTISVEPGKHPSNGGTWHGNNLIVICRKCKKLKGRKGVVQFRRWLERRDSGVAVRHPGLKGILVGATIVDADIEDYPGLLYGLQIESITVEKDGKFYRLRSTMGYEHEHWIDCEVMD